MLLALLICGFVTSILFSFSFCQLANERRTEMERAQKAELRALLKRASALLASQRPGQRLESLQSVRGAISLARDVDPDTAMRLQLRNLAIAAMRLPDIRPDIIHRADCLVYEDTHVCFNSDLQVFAAAENGLYSGRCDGCMTRQSTGSFLSPSLSAGLTRPDAGWQSRGATMTLGHPEVLNLEGQVGPDTWVENLSFASGHVAALTSWRGKAVVLCPGGKDSPIAIDVPAAAAWADLSPDARWLAVGNYHGRSVEVYEVASGRRLFQFDQPRAVPQFSPDGRWLAISGGRRVRIVDTESWRVHAESRELAIEKGMPYFFADGRMLAAPISSPPGVVLLDTATARELATLPADPDAGYGDCWGASPDGRRVVTRDGDNIAGVWDLGAVRQKLSEMGLDWSNDRQP